MLVGLAAAIVGLSGCVTGTYRYVRSEGGAAEDERLSRFECESHGGRIACEVRGVQRRRLPYRFSLRGSRRDLSRSGLLVHGDDVCLVSRRWGIHCVTPGYNREFRAQLAEPLDDRTVMVWEQGVCIESARDEDESRSRFECFYREADVRQYSEFSVAREHRIVEFSQGSCVCNAEPSGVASGLPVPPVGAACFVQDNPLPFGEYGSSRADGLTRGIVFRGGPWNGDYERICDAVEGLSGDAAVDLVLAWEAEAIPLPPEDRPTDW